MEDGVQSIMRQKDVNKHKSKSIKQLSDEPRYMAGNYKRPHTQDVGHRDTYVR